MNFRGQGVSRSPTYFFLLSFASSLFLLSSLGRSLCLPLWYSSMADLKRCILPKDVCTHSL